MITSRKTVDNKMIISPAATIIHPVGTGQGEGIHTNKRKVTAPTLQLPT